MPNANHPDHLALDSIEEPIGPQDDLTVGQTREFGYVPAGSWEPREPTKRPLDLFAKSSCRRRVLASDVLQCGEKLSVSGRSEPDPHAQSSARTASASARTSSRVRPLPAVMSFSPCASNRRIWRSSSACSYDSRLSMTAAALPLWVMNRGCLDVRTRLSAAAAS